MRRVTRKILAAWLAIVAFSLQALWPLLVQAEPRRSLPTASVCSVGGLHATLALPGFDTPAQKRSKACQAHCKLWVAGADRAALPPAPAAALRSALAPALAPAPAAAQEVPSRPVSPAQPRAPPVIS
jgi:Protein of unknown function (DUF2946)